MKLQFNVYELAPKTNIGFMIQKFGIKEFIVVGIFKTNNTLFYKVNSVKLSFLIKGVSIQGTSFDIPKDELKIKGNEICEMNIPEEFLSMKIIKKIQKLNERS